MSHYDDLKRALDSAAADLQRMNRGTSTAEDAARQALRSIDDAKRAADSLEKERDDYERKYRRSRSD